MGSRRLSYDVVVVGGGAAGLAAAVAAARAGARTALVERYGFLGGMATAGMVSTICGLYLTSAGGGPELLNEGLAGTVARRLSAMAGCGPPTRWGRTFVLPYAPFAFACLADALVGSSADLEVYLHAHVAGVETGGAGVEALRIATWERDVDLGAHTVVDASGDAVVAHRAGAACQTPPASERQLWSLVFVFQHVDTEVLDRERRVALLRSVAVAEAEGRLPAGSSTLTVMPSPRHGELICKVALTGLDAELSGHRDAMTAAEQEGRKRVAAVAAFLESTPPFARAFLSHTAPQVGVRESRRVVGRYQLTREDVLSARKFDDGVARASWPIELWEEGKIGATYEFLEDGQAYDIPLRCLRARDHDNLFMAGRCMSATHEALGSARVIGTCLAAGEAAGAAAARVVDGR